MASISLLVSQSMMLAFALANRRLPGFWTLGIGLALNLAVILVNGGFMPISPETVRQLAPEAPSNSWNISQRLGTGKDIVLPVAETKLWILSDHFLMPEWIPYQVAFSLGDVIIAIGAFWALWAIAGSETTKNK